MRQWRLIALLSLALFAWSSPAAAALPPFELVQKSLAQQREKAGTRTLELRVTQSDLREWELSGDFEFGEGATASDDLTIGPKSPTALRLLWIGLLAADPIARLTTDYGRVKTHESTVGVDEGFVYVYGDRPRVAVHRDLKRLAWFEVDDDGATWRAGFTWVDARIAGVLVTRNGKTVLTARSATTLPGAAKRGDD